MEIEPFGQLDPDAIEEFYEGSVTIAGSPVAVELNFEDDSVDPGLLESVSRYLSNLETEAQRAFQEVGKDWDLGEESEAARFYLEHHLEHFTEQEVAKLFASSSVDKEAFMRALKLTRIAFHPEDDESFAIFDIQFPEEMTDYLMAVTFDDERDLSFISMDS